MSLGGLTILPRVRLSHYDVPVSNLDGFRVLDGDVAVRATLRDHVDWVLLVNDCGGRISPSGILCKIIFHSIPLDLSRGQQVAPKSPGELENIDSWVPTPGC